MVRTFVQVFGVKFLQQFLNFNPLSIHVPTSGPRMWNLSVLHSSETREPIWECETVFIHSPDNTEEQPSSLDICLRPFCHRPKCYRIQNDDWCLERPRGNYHHCTKTKKAVEGATAVILILQDGIGKQVFTIHDGIFCYPCNPQTPAKENNVVNIAAAEQILLTGSPEQWDANKFVRENKNCAFFRMITYCNLCEEMGKSVSELCKTEPDLTEQLQNQKHKLLVQFLSCTHFIHLH